MKAMGVPPGAALAGPVAENVKLPEPRRVHVPDTPPAAVQLPPIVPVHGAGLFLAYEISGREDTEQYSPAGLYSSENCARLLTLPEMPEITAPKKK